MPEERWACKIYGLQERKEGENKRVTKTMEDCNLHMENW